MSYNLSSKLSKLLGQLVFKYYYNVTKLELKSSSKWLTLVKKVYCCNIEEEDKDEPTTIDLPSRHSKTGGTHIVPRQSTQDSFTSVFDVSNVKFIKSIDFAYF